MSIQTITLIDDFTYEPPSSKKLDAALNAGWHVLHMEILPVTGYKTITFRRVVTLVKDTNYAPNLD